MTARVQDAVRASDLAQQKARLLSEARRFIARRYLGNTDPSIQFEALSSALEELLLAANAHEQEARRAMASPLKAGSTSRRRARQTHSDAIADSAAGDSGPFTPADSPKTANG